MPGTLIPGHKILLHKLTSLVKHSLGVERRGAEKRRAAPACTALGKGLYRGSPAASPRKSVGSRLGRCLLLYQMCTRVAKAQP